MVKSASPPADAVDNRPHSDFFISLAGSWREASRHSNNSLSMMSLHRLSILNDWGLQSAELLFTLFMFSTSIRSEIRWEKSKYFRLLPDETEPGPIFSVLSSGFCFWLWKQDFTDDGGDVLKFQVRVTRRTLAATFHRCFYSLLSSYGKHGNKVETVRLNIWRHSDR